VVHVCASGENRPTRIDSLLLDLRSKGEVPYFIPTGGSNATGALGYAAMMSELLSQAIDLDISVDHMVLACGSGGTQAGLTVGGMLNQDSPKIIGIDIDGETEELAHHTYLTTTVCAKKLGLRSEIDQDCIELVAGHAAPGYGLPNARIIEAVKLTAQLEGIFLDPVYTGKAMAGFFDMVQKGRFEKHETVVFIHTGGTPGLFAYADIF
jgi:1-aminocyclopropane-1-carboxylate deaminase/D-cysteine desulfhydrase-like pyridoxal-dependent ACC family enzyme